MRRIHRHLSFANVIALVALFVALGGGAYALKGRNTVDSGDLKPRAVRPADTDLTKSRDVAATVQLGNIVTDVAVDDPALTIPAKQGDLLLVHARVEGRREAGGGECGVDLKVTGPDGGSSSVEMRYTTTTFVRKFLASTVGSGAQGISVAVPRGFPVEVPGTYRFNLTLFASQNTTCEFRKRLLLVSVLR